MESTAAIFDYARMPPRALIETSREAIAERLVLLRMAISGDSQVAFCAKTGMSTNAWNNLERARNRISLDSALILARTTGASLDWIYRGPEYEHTLPSSLAAKIRRAKETADSIADELKHA